MQKQKARIMEVELRKTALEVKRMEAYRIAIQMVSSKKQGGKRA